MEGKESVGGGAKSVSCPIDVSCPSVRKERSYNLEMFGRKEGVVFNFLLASLC